MTDTDVLQHRADELARPLNAPADASTRRRLLRFQRAGNRYAVDLGSVRQVAKLDGGAHLPADAWPLLAIAPLDGRIVPVIEPFTKAQAHSTSDPLAWGVAIEARGHLLFLLADQVVGVVDLDDADVAATPSSEAAWSSVGVSPDGDAIIDAHAVITKLERRHADTTHAAGERSARAMKDIP